MNSSQEFDLLDHLFDQLLPICDLAASNLHVVNYSEAVNKHLPLPELQKHLHRLPELPEAVPCVTSCYNRTWAFCLSRRERSLLKDDGFDHVMIDVDFKAAGRPLPAPFAKGRSFSNRRLRKPSVNSEMGLLGISHSKENRSC